MKPLQQRKKSSSFSANTTTINKTTKNNNNLTSCRSVSGFVQSNRNNRSVRDVTKFSIGDNMNNRTTRRGLTNSREKWERLDMSNNNGREYKQMIEKRKKQSVKKNLAEQVLATVDVFHQTLHSLPLDKLILTQNPFYWLQEQAKTLVKLQDKLNKLYPTLRPQTARYYKSKLQSVQNVLKNIRENLQTLDKMTVLKQYNSGATSLQSRNSQSLSSLAASHKGMSLNGEIHNVNVNVNQSNQTVREQKRLKNQVKQGRKFITETQQANNEQQWGQLSQFNNSSKQNNINLNNRQSREPKPVLVKPSNHNIYTTKNTNSYNNPNNEITEKDNFQLQEDYSSTCSHLGNDSSLQKLHYQPKGCIMNNCETVRSEEENRVKFVVDDGGVVVCEEQGGKGGGRKSFKKGSMMTRTIQKYPIMAHSISHITKFPTSNTPSMPVPQPPTFTTSNQSKESLMTSTQPNQNFQYSTISLIQQTKRQSFLPTTQLSNQLAVLQNQAEKLRQQLQIKNRLIVGMQNKHERLIKALKEEFQRKEKQYLETIYELRQDNEDRQEAIRQLLIQKQEQLLDKQSKQQQSRSRQQKLITELQQLQAQLSKLTQQNTLLTNKHTLLSQSLQSLTSQLHQFQVRQQQLRQTVHLQRQRTKKCQAQFQLLQQQLQDKTKQLQLKQTQIVSLQQCIDQLKEKIKHSQTQSQRHNQKQSVYKLKYFRLYAEFDSFKQKVSDDNYYWQKICLSCKKQYTSPQQQPSNSQNQLQLRQLISFHKKRLLN